MQLTDPRLFNVLKAFGQAQQPSAAPDGATGSAAVRALIVSTGVQVESVDSGITYDLEVDTGVTDPDDLAHVVRTHFCGAG